ncbi:flagellar protein FliT [Alkalibacillus filiformis]|uniref:Flagellar protein FliT n=1 Tax=Alkalibacillus filiformis TaxID=200990 RepID=A0ABU0DWN4_9BACI|nr:hypothetical protein [Alkalibacillus filiformis]MDQ0352892.1 flagellar protein FliT [Alkalibacillus filiformis]
MSQVKALYTLTKQMLDRFKQAEQVEREQLINEFDEFVQKRGQVIEQLSGEYTEEEKRIGEETLKIDRELQQLADQYMKNFQKDFASFKKKQVTNKKYINPYQNLQGNDGSFIDKRN